MNTDTMIGNRLALLVPKLCLGTQRSKLCFTERRLTIFDSTSLQSKTLFSQSLVRYSQPRRQIVEHLLMLLRKELRIVSAEFLKGLPCRCKAFCPAFRDLPLQYLGDRQIALDHQRLFYFLRLK